MRHPELFAAVASHAGDMAFELSALKDLPVAARTLRRSGGIPAFVEQFEASEKKSGDDYTTMMVLAQAGAYSPEAGRPGGVALPFDVETGEIDWAVWKRWKAWDPIEMVAAHAEALRQLKLLFVDAGTRDEHNLDLGARDLRGAAARARHRLRAPGVRRRPPRDGLPLRRLAPQAGGGDRRPAGALRRHAPRRSRRAHLRRSR